MSRCSSTLGCSWTPGCSSGVLPLSPDAAGIFTSCWGEKTHQNEGFEIFWLWDSYLAVLRGYSWLCTEELVLEVLQETFEMLGIEPSLAMCKANVRPTVPSLRPPSQQLLCSFSRSLWSHYVDETVTSKTVSLSKGDTCLGSETRDYMWRTVLGLTSS